MRKNPKVFGEQLGEQLFPKKAIVARTWGCHPPQAVDSEQQGLGLPEYKCLKIQALFGHFSVLLIRGFPLTKFYCYVQ